MILGERPDKELLPVYLSTQIPKDQIEKNHNKEAMALLAVKQSELTIESQATGSEYIPRHNFKDNFLDYYKQFVEDNKRKGNRDLESSYNHFKAFLKKSYIAPVGITENLCFRFRQYLLSFGHW